PGRAGRRRCRHDEPVPVRRRRAAVLAGASGSAAQGLERWERLPPRSLRSPTRGDFDHDPRRRRLMTSRTGLLFLGAPAVPEMVKLARRAEAAGFESAWVA